MNIRSACTCASARTGRSSRGVASSPPCGPAAVTRVPATHSAPSTPTVAQVSSCSGRGTTGAGGSSVSSSRTSTTMATNISASEISRCGATVHQISPVSTMMPPQTAWNSTPSGSTAASSTSDRRRGRASQISRKVPSEAISTTLVSVRLPNSIAWWNGGQVGAADRHHRPGMAFRPGRAAEPGPGDPDGRAGDRDQPVRDHRGPGEGALQPVRWAAAATRPAGGADAVSRGGGRHCHRNHRTVAAQPTTIQADSTSSVSRRRGDARPAAPPASPATSRRAGVSSPIARSAAGDGPAARSPRRPARTPARAGSPRPSTASARRVPPSSSARPMNAAAPEQGDHQHPQRIAAPGASPAAGRATPSTTNCPAITASVAAHLPAIS